MRQQITVQYTASEEVANPVELAAFVQKHLESHLKSVEELAVSDCELTLQICRFEFDAARGKVGMKLSGSIDRKPVDESFLCVDLRPKVKRAPSSRMSTEKRRTWRNEHSPMAVFASIIFDLLVGTARACFPSEVAHAIGDPLSCGRVLRALDDCMADVRMFIDQTAGYPESGGWEKYRTGRWRSVLAGLLSIIAAIPIFVLGNGRPGDSTAATFGCLFAGFGISGMIYGWTLLTLPERFYSSEKTGRRLLFSLGFRKSIGIRRFSAAMCLISVLFTTAGLYWLCF
ncbi:MAG: hypothetical protein KDB01_06770 [Planctomycetaceae bacterium]|nr:hypothetical protein [Planctomycetaceae bacterium]